MAIFYSARDVMGSVAHETSLLKEVSYEEREKLKQVLLGMMQDLHEACVKYEIGYSLHGGTALGAIRHKGFIPWDDDLDIFMTPANYERFRNAFKKKGDKSRYYLQELGFTDGMITTAKIRLNGTTYIEETLKDWDIHQGIFIDIFLLHSCPNTIFQQLHQCFWAKYVVTKGTALRENGRHKGIKGFAIKLAQLTPERFLIKHALKQVYKYRNKETKYYCNFLGKAIFKKGIYRREWFDNPVYAPFETVQLKVPGKLHDFLRERFGDYMKIPTPDNIKYAQHAESWDFHNQLIISEKFEDEKRLL